MSGSSVPTNNENDEHRTCAARAPETIIDNFSKNDVAFCGDTACEKEGSCDDKSGAQAVSTVGLVQAGLCALRAMHRGRRSCDLDDGGDAQCRTIAAGGSVILMSINDTSIWIAMLVLCVSHPICSGMAGMSDHYFLDDDGTRIIHCGRRCPASRHPPRLDGALHRRQG